MCVCVFVCDSGRLFLSLYFLFLDFSPSLSARRFLVMTAECFYGAGWRNSGAIMGAGASSGGFKSTERTEEDTLKRRHARCGH